MIKYKTYDLAADANTLAGYLLGENEPQTSLRGACGVKKQATWSEPIPLEEVKALGTAMGGTINDVMLAAVAGGLRRYLIGRGETIDFEDLRVVVPFNVRLTLGPGDLGNQVGMVLLPLPVGIEAASERFREVKSRMDALKESHDPNMIYGLLN